MAGTAVREGWGSQESVALKLWRGEVWGGPQAAALRLDSLCPSHTGRPHQSEVENRHIKEVTDTFTLIQVVDVIVVSGGRRKAEKGGKHCREYQTEAWGQGPTQQPPNPLSTPTPHLPRPPTF